MLCVCLFLDRVIWFIHVIPGNRLKLSYLSIIQPGRICPSITIEWVRVLTLTRYNFFFSPFFSPFPDDIAGKCHRSDLTRDSYLNDLKSSYRSRLVGIGDHGINKCGKKNCQDFCFRRFDSFHLLSFDAVQQVTLTKKKNTLKSSHSSLLALRTRLIPFHFDCIYMAIAYRHRPVELRCQTWAHTVIYNSQRRRISLGEGTALISLYIRYTGCSLYWDVIIDIVQPAASPALPTAATVGTAGRSSTAVQPLSYWLFKRPRCWLSNSFLLRFICLDSFDLSITWYHL